MKSYELFKPQLFKAGTVNGFEKITIIPDPKRPGLYKASLSQSIDNYKRSFSHAYGKCNQAHIQELIMDATEI